jgi:large subunit ribosomal protein L22
MAEIKKKKDGIEAVGRFFRVPPDKVRIMARNIVGLKVEEAINILNFTPNKTAYLLKKVLASAVANAVHNNNLDVEDLKVYRVFVDRGPMLKRFQPCSHGRAQAILKRMSHITVKVK